MSVAGAIFAGAVLAIVAAGVWMEMSWRVGRSTAPAPAAALSCAALSPAPPVEFAPGLRYPLWVVVRAVVVAVVTAALSVASALVLARGQLDGSLPTTGRSALGWLALAVAAIVVAVVFSGSGSVRGPLLGSVVALTLGAPPAWVVITVATFNEGDAFWLIAALMFIAASSVVSVATWVLVTTLRWGQAQVRWFLGALRNRPEQAR